MGWKKMIWLPLCFAVPFGVNAATLQERIQLLEQQLNELKTQVSKNEQTQQQIQAQAAKASPLDKLKINGFFTGAMAKSNNDVGYAGVGKTTDFNQRSLAGIQFQYNFTDATSITTQIVARGYQDWKPKFEWAFLKHGFDNGVVVRAGKLRLPLYMYSDYLEVGYSQPWSRPPTEVYDVVPVTSYTGADILYDFDLNWATLTMQAFGGVSTLASDETSFAVPFQFDNIVGLNANLNIDDLNLRGVYAQTQITATDASGGHNISVPINGAAYPISELDGSSAWFGGLGASYDNGEYLAVMELTRTKVNGLYPDTDSGYLTLGYHFGEWTPYITGAFLRTSDDSNRLSNPVSSGVYNGKRNAYSLGVRYDIAPNIAVKGDLTYTNSFGSTTGVLGNTTADTNSLVYTLNVDAAF